MLSWLKSFIRFPRVANAGYRRWYPGEEILLYRSEHEDLERLLDFQESGASDAMSKMLSPEEFEHWQLEAPRRRAHECERLIQQRQQYRGR